MTTLTHQTVTAGSTITKSIWDTTMAEILAALDAIQGDQIQGGITKRQLVDRFSVAVDTVCIVPLTSVDNGGGGGQPDLDSTNAIEFLVPDSMESMVKVLPPLRDGMETFLAGIVLWVKAVIQDTSHPFVEVYRNTTLIGNGGVNLDVDDDFYRLVAGSDPIQAPMSSWSKDDYLDFQLGRSSGSGNPSCRGLFATVTWKFEHTQ